MILDENLLNYNVATIFLSQFFSTTHFLRKISQFYQQCSSTNITCSNCRMTILSNNVHVLCAISLFQYDRFLSVPENFRFGCRFSKGNTTIASRHGSEMTFWGHLLLLEDYWIQPQDITRCYSGRCTILEGFVTWNSSGQD